MRNFSNLVWTCVFACSLGTLPAVAEESGDSSAELRRDKSYIAFAELLGIGTGLMRSSSGITGGKYLDSDSILEASIAVSSGSDRDFSSSNSVKENSIEYQTSYSGRATNVALRYKKFFANSFYGYAGPSYRQTDAKMSLRAVSGLIATNDVDVAEVSMRDIGVDGAIGNAWQWDNFTMGCDWIGLHVPVARLKNDYDDKGVNLASIDKVDDNRTAFVRQARGPGIMMLRFYLGASF